MLFKNPSVLYALFALLIPIIIHLFKLRKFQKTAFTNVLFLEKIKIQSRKSSQLKKWLILLSRLGIFALLILAFALPYLPAKSNLKQPDHYIIYLDNSFSMEAEGNDGPILKRAIQDIISNFESDAIFTLFTNTGVFKDIRLSEVQNEILDIQYTYEQLSPTQIILKHKNLIKNKSNTAFVAISDFQKKYDFNYTKLKSEANYIVQLIPQKKLNTAIDSLWLSSENNQKLLNVTTSSSEKSSNVILSIFNEKKLIGKAIVDFSKNASQITQIPLPKNTSIEGLVTIENTEGLDFDNYRYFSINQPPKTNVLVIGLAFYDFLQKIYSKDEFEFTTTSVDLFNTKKAEKANIIILNEIERFPTSLEQSLTEFIKEGGTLCVIPTSKNIENLNRFLNSNFNIEFEGYSKIQKKITQISFQHPLFKEVFTKDIANFQYPTINESYRLKSKNWILNLEDNSPFLIQKNNVFVFASPLNKQITNFKNSPLIVPVFYNMTKQNYSTSAVAYIIGEENVFNININQNQDEVLSFKNLETEFIPLQQVFRQHVKITTNELPKKAGNYKIISNDRQIQTVSYNYSTEEGQLSYSTLFDIENDKFSTSVSDFFKTSKANFQTTDLWKWFLIFALFFILVEIILLKFLK